MITIDGPAASGKGTVAKKVADRLEFHYLDSGALYRVTALAALNQGVDMYDAQAVSRVAQNLEIQFLDEKVLLAQQDVSSIVRTEKIGGFASIIAVFPAVRTALLNRQRAFQKRPGLVTDGRDMGSVVFPNANLKIFLTASAQVRAERRYKQLISNNLIDEAQSGIFPGILSDLQKRDEQDRNRAEAPLVLQVDAKLLDTSNMSIEDTVEQILLWNNDRLI